MVISWPASHFVFGRLVQPVERPCSGFESFGCQDGNALGPGVGSYFLFSFIYSFFSGGVRFPYNHLKTKKGTLFVPGGSSWVSCPNPSCYVEVRICAGFGKGFRLSRVKRSSRRRMLHEAL